MREARIVWARVNAFQEEIENRERGFDVQVERAIDKLEGARAAIVELRHLREKTLGVERLGRFVER